jgi:hypothetical protein
LQVVPRLSLTRHIFRSVLAEPLPSGQSVRVDGERGRDAILSSLAVKRRGGTDVYVSASSVSIPDAAATIQEDEGTTFVGLPGCISGVSMLPKA